MSISTVRLGRSTGFRSRSEARPQQEQSRLIVALDIIIDHLTIQVIDHLTIQVIDHLTIQVIDHLTIQAIDRLVVQAIGQ
jgi:hypothetical protein